MTPDKKIRLLCLYQVIMHYRTPFYERLTKDPDFEFKLIYGRGKHGTKLVNTEISEKEINAEKMFDLRIPTPFTPLLFFKLIKENPHIIFSEGSSSLINSSIAFLYSKIFRKKFIWWSLGKLKNKNYKGVRRLINKWEHYIEMRSDAIFTYSSKGKEYFIQRGVKSSKIYVAVNVFDTEAKLKEIRLSYERGFLEESAFNIGFIGTIEKSKRLDLLIDSVAILNNKYGNIKLHIIGDGKYLNEIKKHARGSENVVFYGRVSSGSSKILGNCDLFVLPGLGGLAICEAMLNSLPIITGNADGTEYDLVDSQNGFILEEMSVSSLVQHIELLYKNNDIRLKMKEASFNKITKQYSFENYYSVFKAMVRSLIS